MSIKKKLISFLTSAACLVSCVCVAGAIKDDEVNAAAVNGQDAFGITSQMKIGWNLGNSLDSTSDILTIESSPKKFAETWGNPEPTTELIDAVKAGGFNTIRIPVTWYQHLYQENGTYKIDDKWMAYVKKFVDYAYNQDMFVILNMHHEDFINVSQFTDATLNDATQKLTGVWTRLSEEFKDYDQKLIFEGMNEPREMENPSNSEWGDGDTNSWNYINKLNKVFIDVVRGQGSAANKERLLMLPGYHAGNSVSTVRAIDVPSDAGNVALSVHAYNPYFFCMDNSNMANHTYPGNSGYGQSYEDELRTMFSSYKSIIAEKNVPIIMGEFSASDFSNTESRVNWAKDYLSLAKDAGIPCVLWDNNVVAETVTNPEAAGEAHGYLYRATNTWYPNSKPVIAAMMDTVGVTGYSLPDYEEYVAPPFSWDNIKIGSDWIKIYRNESGAELDAWASEAVSGYQQYLNEDYALVMIMDSEQEPGLVAQTSTGEGGWHYILSDNDNNTDFVYFYTYDDIVNTLTSAGDSMSAINGLYLSARFSEAKAYGLYAVPVGSLTAPTEPPTEKPTEDVPTEPTTEIVPPKNYARGDVDHNGIINVIDSAILRGTLMSVDKMSVLLNDDLRFISYDVDGNGYVSVNDLVLLNRYLIGKATIDQSGVFEVLY
ncbi:MAG: cellulase family glycosylhydrolase [Clostridium sp.]|nr:cellulase family glycosylhydrolase [Clostridium sp.]MCM1547774.1 cellulase family glycosylhydrolase [Ruminococcus sp.]